jgi:hypothetical protein
MEKLYVCDNGVNREYTETEYEQARIDAEQAQARLPDEVRKERNRLLTASDWTQIPDCTVDKQAWATYRQALRDITNQSGFPTNVTWPTKPQA